MKKIDLTPKDVVVGYMITNNTFYAPYKEMNDYMLDIGYRALLTAHVLDRRFCENDFIKFVYNNMEAFSLAKGGIMLENHDYLKQYANTLPGSKRYILGLNEKHNESKEENKKEDDLVDF